MSEEDRELLLDASFNLSYFVELAGNLVLILTTEPPEDEKKAVESKKRAKRAARKRHATSL